MANFQINVLQSASESFNNEPTIAFFNVFRGMFQPFEDSSRILHKKINSEVLLRDVIKDNGALKFNQNTVIISDSTPGIPIELGTMSNPNNLSKVAFIFKESYFESATTDVLNPPLPQDLLMIDENTGSGLVPVTYSSPGNVKEYNITDLNRLFIKNHSASKFFNEAVRGYLDIYYNFRTDDTVFDTVIEKWSLLRIQFGFAENTSSYLDPYYFTQINVIRKTDYTNEISVSNVYPLEYLKGTDVNGELIPLYHYGPNNIADTTSGVEIASRIHTSGVSGITKLPVINDTVHMLNASGIAAADKISGLDNDPNIPVYIAEMIKVDGAPHGITTGTSRYYNWHIFALIEDTDYIPLVG